VEISFTRHVLEKLERYLRHQGISEDDIIDTIRKPDIIVYDTLENRYVALNYDKNLAVVYEKNDKIIVVTAIYSSKLRDLVERRRRSGRWI